jgi:uncharacterized protein (TIGR02466 family)
MKDYDIIPLFAKPLYVSKLSLKEEDFLNLYNFSKKCFEDKNSNIENRSKSLSILKDENLLYLNNIIHEELNNYTKNFLYYDNIFKITTSWFAIQKSDSPSNWHRHHNCMFSGVFYFNDGNSPLNFIQYDNSNGFVLLPTKINSLNNSDFSSFHPEKGNLLIFPSNIYHTIGKTSKNRYSLAFNAIPTGNFGFEDSQLNLNYDSDNYYE